MSSVLTDYQNSPNASAKALELTKNCKTEAEKITAVFNYVAKTLQYDYELYESEHAYLAAGGNPLMMHGTRNLNPDVILESKKGVCEHFSVLMVSMLRSIGIPCKVASGSTMKNDGSTERHAWVVVKPTTGTLNMSALGARMEPNGEWIQLDPTWGRTNSGRASAAKDDTRTVQYYY